MLHPDEDLSKIANPNAVGSMTLQIQPPAIQLPKPGQPVYVPPMISPTERAMDWEFYLHTMKELQGNILTLLDASFPEGRQGKAVKDLVKQSFRERITRSNHFFFDGVCTDETKPEYNTD